ncbi:MAG: hypothetical protein LC754_14165, partial [Acidobacteria bacterium]|nr:hypothetical protein [Acidobacteriota bacterium]
MNYTQSLGNRRQPAANRNAGARWVLFTTLAFVVFVCVIPLSRARGAKLGAGKVAPSALVASSSAVANFALTVAPLFAGPTPTVLHMHGNPTDDSGCTGNGAADISIPLCNGPSLKASATLGTGTAAHWDIPDPAAPGVGTADRNTGDPNWIWNITGPTTIGGQMPVQWWASCGACNSILTADWRIRIFADGVKKFEQRITASPATPDVTQLLGANLYLHENFPAETTNPITANTKIVIHIDPVFLDSQANTHIYYDSQSPCPGTPPTNTAPCDSQVTMPVLAPGDPLPTPTPTPASIQPAVLGSGLAPRFQNFNPPQSMLTTAKGTDAGEPSIGVNWKTNKAMFVSGLTTLRVTFDDSCPTTPSATWEDKSAPNSATSLDPILFTDHGYNNQTPTVGRTFVSQLTGQDSLSAYTDDDGQTWTPSQGGGIPSGVDHQSIGSGPFHVPLTGGTPLFPNAVYYCSQDVATAFCARSDDGGLTFGPGVPAYLITQCSNLHGHVKVGPDGTVYLANRNCGGNAGVIVSEDNGNTWEVRPAPGTGAGRSDSTVAIGRGDETAGAGRVYLSFGRNDTQAGVAVSDDHGRTWPKVFDVGALAGIKAVAFPEMVVGDDARAAAAFLGSTTAGNAADRAFPGQFHLYVFTTYDGGQTWLPSDATPNDPVQINGIHLGGGSPPHRNLLDFNGIDIDKQGRVLVGYADGCSGPACAQASASATGNSYTALAAIARQTGGRRLFAGSDPAEPTVPGAPSLTVLRDGSVAHLKWSESDDGGSSVTSYSVLRGTTSGGETLLANVGTATSFDDTTANPSVTYFYKVTAMNAVGSSCGSNEVLARWIGDSQCAGLREVLDPTGDQKGAPADADLDVQEVRVADIVEGGVNKLVFKMKVANLSMMLPDRQWRILWNYPIKPDNTTPFTGTYYIGMNTDANSATSFEYGTVTTVETVPTNTSTPNKIGAADSGSVNQQSGIITIVLSTSKVGSPHAGDVVGALIGRTFSGNGNQTVLANSSVDTTSRGAQDPFTGVSYQLVGNLPCPALLNYALSTLGGVASASSTYTSRNYSPLSAIDGERAGANWESGGGWNDATRGVWPDTLQIDMNGSKTINQINVYTLQDNFKQPVEPTPTMTCGLYGLIDFDVQSFDGTNWVTVPGGAIRGN